MDYNYGKKSLWKWILLYIIIGGVIYGLVYYLFFTNKGHTYNPQAYQYIAKQSNTHNYTIQNMNIQVEKEGSGEAAKSGDIVTVHYVGTLENGIKFDSSIDRQAPFQFTLGENRVIKGWELGVVGMKVGEKRKLTIPPELGYGATGIGYGGKFGCVGVKDCDPNKETYVIPQNAILIFEVELLKIN